MAYLMENGELVGRLPDITISGDFFDLLGKDYVGTSHDDPIENVFLTACMMDVEKN
jgi:predicted Zn-dependent protease